MDGWRGRGQWARRNALLLAQALIAVVALLLDLLGDRSLGAWMLSTLPIALISGGCCLIAPWTSGGSRRSAFRAWLAGTALVLIITASFASLGSAQAKDGELIFTYACLLMAMPSSLLLPFVMDWSETLLQPDLVTRILIAWTFCVAAGGLLWWISSLLRGRRSDQNLAGPARQESTAMNLTVFPLGRQAVNLSDLSGQVDDASLGGFFYDYLRAEEGRIAGVRYHLMESVEFGHHAEYSSYLRDPRFVFDLGQGFVDIVFEERDADALQRGTLRLDVVQDFGGDCVLQNNGAFGIGFSIPKRVPSVNS